MDEKGIQKASDNDVVYSRKMVYKNLLVIGFAQLLSYAATNPTNALVTTTAGKTLGNTTFGLNYIFSCLFSFFTISIFNKQTSKRNAILFAIACIVGFTACNWYVSYYTLIPGTLLFGVGVSSSWIITLTYIKKLSVNYSKGHSFNEQHITSLFTGIVIGMAVAGYVLGNATTSGILMLLKPNDNENDTVPANELKNLTNGDNLKECHTNDDKLYLNFITMNTLRGLFVLYSLLGLIIVLFLDDLEKQSSGLQVSFKLTVLNHVKNIWLNLNIIRKLSAKMEMVLSLPLFITVGASGTFAFAKYTKTYVAECMGVHVVGHAIMVYGLSNSLGSFISGKLLSLGIKNLLVLGILILHLTIIIFLAVWEREPLLHVLLFIIFLWGFCDGSWTTVCSSFAITYFEKEQTRHSFAMFRMVVLVAMGFSALANLMISVKVYLIILCAMFLMFAPLHLMVTYCSDPCPYIFNELPVYFIDE